MSEVINRWPDVIKEFDKLNNLYVAVGFFAEGEDAQLLTIVRANEYGAHIQPRNGAWLTIPTKDTPMGSDGGPMPAREIPGVFRPGDKHVLAVADGSGGLKIVYYLVKEVTIPARPFIRTALIDSADDYRRIVLNGVAKITAGKMTARQLMEILGNLAVASIRKQMVGWSKPGNAPATTERKGTNNPLVDKGILTRSVTYKVLEGGWL